MDGLSTAANVMAVIQLVQVIGSVLKDYYEAVRDARKEIQQLYQATQSLKITLDVFQKLESRPKSSSELSPDTTATLQQCFRVLWQLKEKLPRDGEVRRAQKLKWPFQRADIAKAVDVIERHKSLLNMQIGLENLQFNLEELDILAQIRLDIQNSQESANRDRIVKWLLQSVPNPSVEHRLARDKHEETTGSWLVNGAELKQWKAAKNSLLWLNGGAGSGKSILCSTVIEYAKDLCGNDPSSVVAYWYFTFSDSEKQKVSHFLSHVIASIVSNRRDTPEALHNAYRDSNYGLEKPSLQDLTSMLWSVIAGFDNVFVIVDALDECPKGGERLKLFDTLEDIMSWQLDSLHVFITSRAEIDVKVSVESIATSLGNGGVQIISVQGTHVQEDIQKFLKNSLEGRRFRFWKPGLKEDVKEYLASKADGMFRLVALELDTLSKLRSDFKIRNAMKELPKSLDLFYERTLNEISDEDHDFAYIAFQWLAFALRPLTLKELATAMAISSNDGSFNGDHLDCTEVLDILPTGLIKVFTESGEISKNIQEGEANYSLGSAVTRFAHFSVKEYLLSTRVNERFRVTEVMAHNTIAEQCLVYLLHFQPTQVPITGLFRYASSYWPWHFQLLEQYHLSPSLRSLAEVFLTSESTAWSSVMNFYSQPEPWNPVSWPASPQDWERITSCLGSSSNFAEGSKMVHPLILVAQLGLHDLVLLLLSKTDVNKIPHEQIAGGPLHCAARSGHAQIVRTLLAHGAHIDAESNDCGTPLYETAKWTGDGLTNSLKENFETCRLLLLENANVNAETGVVSPMIRCKQSPLVAAACAGKADVVRLFLENGADPDLRPGGWESALEIITNAKSSRASLVSTYSIEVVRCLLEFGANVNATVIRGSVLHRALRTHGLETIRLLIEKGADVHSTNDLDNVQQGPRKFSLPLSQHVIAQVTGSYLHINWILEASPLKYLRNSEVIEILIDAGADPRKEGLWEYLLDRKNRNLLGYMTWKQFSDIENRVRALVKDKVKLKRKTWLRNQNSTDSMAHLWDQAAC